MRSAIISEPVLRANRVIRTVVLLATFVAASAGAEEVLVFAGASLTDALQELGERFETEHGARVWFHFAASGDLARQIRAGAPADVFFSADATRMDELVSAGLVSARARRDPIGNSLVVVVPRGAGDAPRRAADLLTLDRLALGDPDTVPAGHYARRYLRAVGIWGRLLPAIVPLRDVRAALSAVAAGHAPAAIVYSTDAAYDDRVRVAFAIPLAGLPPIRYSVAPIEGASPVAAELARFLTAEAALGVYERHGFARVGSR